MSNDTHDTTETTGARLTDDDVRIITGWQANYGEAGIAPTPSDVQVRTIIADDLIHWALPALLADHAALVAEVARLQAENTGLRHWRDIGQRAGRKLLAQRNAAEAREAAMRPLVEALAESDPSQAAGDEGDRQCHHCYAWLEFGEPHAPTCVWRQARALVATWQTPAAPTPDAQEGGDA